MKSNKNRKYDKTEINKESRVALLTKLIEKIDENSSKMTSGQIRMYLWDAISVK